MLSVVEPKSQEAKEAAASFSGLDVYWRPEYLLLSETAGEGKGYLCVYEGEQGRVLYPFLKKETPVSSQGQQYFDIASPYGYSGPFFAPFQAEKGPALAREFAEAFALWCKEEHVVSEFVRFHPLLGNHALFLPQESLQEQGLSLFLDLSQSEEKIVQGFAAKTKRNIRKAERSGLQVVFDRELTELDAFQELYRGTMERRQVASRYLFGREYFQRIKEHLADSAFLALVKKGEQAASAAIFFTSGPFLGYHLGGSDPDFFSFRPNDLLFSRVAFEGKRQGYKFFHLGGGVGARQDSLFEFKRSFTPHDAPWFLAKVIRDESVYAELAQDKETDFFPAYRG